MVMASHVGDIVLPTPFRAANHRGEWLRIDLDAGPIFKDSLGLGMAMHHSEQRPVFANVALRGSVMAAVDPALASGAPLKDSTLSGPALVGIRAEGYLARKIPWWRRLLPPLHWLR
jgi:hypothetical protein